MTVRCKHISQAANYRMVIWFCLDIFLYVVQCTR